jgi:hypothetical protein
MDFRPASMFGVLVLALSSFVWIAIGTGTTFRSKVAPHEAAAMNWFEANVLFGAPLAALLIGLGVAYLAARDARKNDQHRIPGE